MGDQNVARQAERHIEQHGDGASLFFEGEWYTRGGMADRAARFATGLSGLGVRPGDRLVVLMANCPEVLITYSAAWRGGAVVAAPVFPGHRGEIGGGLGACAGLVASGPVGIPPRGVAAAAR